MTELEPLLSDAMEICRVPSFTGQEEQRGRLLAEKLRREGVPSTVDGAGNVIGEIAGEAKRPLVVVAAHLDTVFPPSTPLHVEREQDVVYGPGIGDNALGVAVLVALARRLPRDEAQTVLLVGTVGEEGNGDLRGVRRLFADRGDEIEAFVAVEGGMGDRVVTRALGIERIRILVEGPGGHSWTNAGTPSALWAAARLVERLYAVELPADPRTTLNVGTLSSGDAVNSIPASASLDVDLRSTDGGAVKGLRARVIETAAGLFAKEEALSVSVTAIGSRPAGDVPRSSPILAAVAAARAAAGLPPATAAAASTDASVAIARGIPATCLGLAVGSDAHRTGERISVAGIGERFEALLATVTRAAGGKGTRTSGRR